LTFIEEEGIKMGKLSIGKKYHFDAAHKLDGYEGKCKNLHGHRWTIEIEVWGDLKVMGSQKGMIIDFHELDSIMEQILKFYDHQLLNDTIENPTCENIVGSIGAGLYGRLRKVGLILKSLTVWETPESFAKMEFKS